MMIAETDRPTMPRPFVFVLMPFAKSFDDIYALGIKQAAEAAGAYAERVDEQIFQNSILDRVYNQIAKADCVVADMSGRNANVFYEVGYAHALGKTVILITQDADDIPFDLKHFPHIVYGGRIVELSLELQKRLRFWLAHGAAAVVPVAGTLSVQVNGNALDADPEIVIVTPLGSTRFDIVVDLHNSIDREIVTLNGQAGLVTSDHFPRAETDPSFFAQTFSLQDGRRLHYALGDFQLLPGAWSKVKISPTTNNVALATGETYEMAIRVFMAGGFADFPFRATIHSQHGVMERHSER